MPEQGAVGVGDRAGGVADADEDSAARQCYERWQQRICDDGLDPATATLVRLAVDGWWMARLLGLAPPRDGLHTEVRARLTALISEEH